MEQPLDDGGRRHVRLEEERGAAKVSNVVDARRGSITNVILFTDPESKAEALRVRLTARAVGARRLETRRARPRRRRRLCANAGVRRCRGFLR